MQQKRRRGVVATENFMQPEVLESRLEKFNKRDFESYEYVFYTNHYKGWNEDAETSVVKGHLKGTNQYLFEFPGAWRTKSGGELIIGIRSIKLKTISRPLTCLLRWRPYLGLLWLSYNPFSFALGLEVQASDILEYLNKAYLDYPKDGSLVADSKPFFNWRYLPDSKRFMFREWQDNYDAINNYTIELVGTDTEIFEFGTMDMPIYEDPDGPPTLVKRPYVGMKWNRHNVLVKADFISQADNQHLGYTGSEYYPLKQYEIKRNTPYFTISLFEDETMNPIELPEDGMDYVVIEAVISRKYEV
jgi:hypothetical protein